MLSSFLDPSALGAIFNTVLTAGGYLYAWFVSRSRAASAEIDTIKADLATRAKLADLEAVEVRIAEAEKRLLSIEGDIKHLPDRDMVHQLQLAISDLSGTVKAMDAQIASLGRTVGNIDGYLRKDDK